MANRSVTFAEENSLLRLLRGLFFGRTQHLTVLSKHKETVSQIVYANLE